MGLGSIERPTLVKGRWRARVWWVQADGRRKSTYVYAATEREALKLAQARQAKEAQDVERERAGLLVRRTECPTLTAFVLENLDAIYATATDRHRRGQLACLGRWVEPTLGDTRLDQITRGDVAAVVGAMRKAGRKGGTANRVLSSLSLVLAHAEAAGLVPFNVCRGGGPRLTSREAPPEVECYTAEEVARIVDAAVADPHSGPRWGPFIALAAYTGARPKSVRLLKVGDLRLDAEPPVVVYRRTKSGKDLVVPLVARLVEILRPAVAGRAADEYLLPSLEPDGTPVPSRPVHTHTNHRAWPRALEAAGVRPLTFYALRRSFATVAFENNMPATIVRDLMGHSSLMVTNRYAGHATRTTQAAALDRLWRGADTVQSPTSTGENE